MYPGTHALSRSSLRISLALRNRRDRLPGHQVGLISENSSPSECCRQSFDAYFLLPFSHLLDLCRETQVYLRGQQIEKKQKHAKTSFPGNTFFLPISPPFPSLLDCSPSPTAFAPAWNYVLCSTPKPRSLCFPHLQEAFIPETTNILQLSFLISQAHLIRLCITSSKVRLSCSSHQPYGSIAFK